MGRTSIPAVPVRSQLLDESKQLTRVWIEFFQSLGGPKYFVESHALRLEKFKPGDLPVGTRFFESDRSVYYIVADGTDGHEWHVQNGEMRGTLSTLPGDLTAADAGFVFVATDYDRRFRWSGSAWVRDTGETPTGAIAAFSAIPSSGWHVCDGSSVTRTKADATTESFTTPDLSASYLKGGTYTGAVVAAVGAALTGDTGAAGAHTHAIDHDHGAFASGTPSATVSIAVGSGAAAVAGSATHTHSVDVPAYAGASGSTADHTHGAGTLATDNTAEPAHVLVYWCTRL